MDLLPPPFNVLLALGILVVPGTVLAWLAHGARAWGGPWLGTVPGLVLAGTAAWLAYATACDLALLLAAEPAPITSPWHDRDAALLMLLMASLALAAAAAFGAALFQGNHTSLSALVWLNFATCLTILMFPIGMPLLAALILGRLAGRWLALALLLVTLSAIAAPFAYFDVQLPWSLVSPDYDRRATTVAVTAWLLLAVVMTASRMANWAPRD